MSRPPFRADHVGSYLRPERLRAARERFAAGHMAAQELHAIEDDCIREVVHAQEHVGLSGITDGEFRRTYFHIDFFAAGMFILWIAMGLSIWSGIDYYVGALRLLTLEPQAVTHKRAAM